MAADKSGGGDGPEPMDFQEEELASSMSSVSDTKFDITIGHIEDIIMEDGFQTLQRDFMEKHYEHFEDTDENKFIYTDIHKNYTTLIETYIDEQLRSRMPGFDMDEFAKQLEKRKESLDGEVFEMLYTFTDFLTFKELFLDYKADKEGRTVDLSCGIMVTPLVEAQPSEPTAAAESQQGASSAESSASKPQGDQ
ncbi:ADP-ribosylation factor-like protein 2-binding protein [Amphiura filiformis]|uniref:ADP-ribosylation factor-like protein 2-binding protein n=1 Tax=Amphiura filiformis TaxID=82378 RepID=UPI003B21D1CB